ncbi:MULTISPECIES: ABC transporter permease subunit [Burkholderiaceae]|jgi:taurine transport system permease protein|uniref:ABC transporter permease subunit n=2 Tax=Burkholderiales TaxID=80840 RepID=UPI00079ADAD3|nr:taurine ABC transporter permease [Cupriavidus metallidurans]MCA3185396.1 ABC transporter permease subunit [Cupriavidus sp.]QWE98386.1 ABC transporter permease subunit [Cupriavidus sp. EM10]KWW32467.1 putative aliphatic sulfonates transport permease protein SsuC [Cupriavidus metallidurans]MCA3193999.1 ABC transporter permease subunit [Cupriavidus sp.]
MKLADPPWEAATRPEPSAAHSAARTRRHFAAMRGWPRWPLGVAVVMTALVMWEMTTRSGWVDPLFLPSPESVMSQLYLLSTDGFEDATLLSHLGWSVTRVLAAFGLAVVTAVPIGALTAMSRTACAVLDPFIEFYRPLPPLAYLPLLVLWLGIGETSKIVLIYLAMFAPIVLNTRAGVQSIPIEQIRAACSLGATRRQLLQHVMAPGALPSTLTGMRIAMGFGWTTLVAAEMVAATAGLGFMVHGAAKFMATDVVIAGILAIGCVGLLFDLCMRGIEGRWASWKRYT